MSLKNFWVAASVAAVFFAPSVSRAQVPATFTESKTTYPLMAWDYAEDLETIRNMAECGINQIAFVPDELSVLDICTSFGIQAVVFDESLSGPRWDQLPDPAEVAKNLPAVIEKVGHHPAVIGYHIKDEPGAVHYPGLAKCVEVVNKLAPGKWPYINLLPNFDKNWEQYLDEFLTVTKSPILSYDKYVIVDPPHTFVPDFFSCLAVARRVAQKHNVPLFNIVLTAPHWGYRELTPADIYMQVYGSLVYGVRGLAYYKFMSHELDILDAPPLGNFRGGPLDEFGNRTQTWDWLRNANQHVQNLAPHLLRLHSDSVYHIGGTIPGDNHTTTADSLISGIKGGEWVVGDFTHEDGSRYVMVVNRSMVSNNHITAAFHPSIDRVDYVEPRSGKVKLLEMPHHYWLAPGQGLLLKVSGKDVPAAAKTGA